jgi:hypothetical protein
MIKSRQSLVAGCLLRPVTYRQSNSKKTSTGLFSYGVVCFSRNTPILPYTGAGVSWLNGRLISIKQDFLEQNG